MDADFLHIELLFFLLNARKGPARLLLLLSHPGLLHPLSLNSGLTLFLHELPSSPTRNLPLIAHDKLHLILIALIDSKLLNIDQILHLSLIH